MVFINIERYQKINIYARRLDQVYPNAERMAVSNNMAFFNQCLRRFPSVSFSNSPEQTAYLHIHQKTYTVEDQAALDQQRQDAQLDQLFELILSPRIAR
jgi:hypothetical protein